jgi:hypothetical protein
MTKRNLQVKERLARNPLHFVGKSTAVACSKCRPVKTGKAVPFYMVMNYNEFHTCTDCHWSPRYGGCASLSCPKHGNARPVVPSATNEEIAAINAARASVGV